MTSPHKHIFKQLCFHKCINLFKITSPFHLLHCPPSRNSWQLSFTFKNSSKEWLVISWVLASAKFGSLRFFTLDLSTGIRFSSYPGGRIYRGMFMLWLQGLKDIKKTPTHSALPPTPNVFPTDLRMSGSSCKEKGMTTLLSGCERETESFYNRWFGSKQWLNSFSETLEAVLSEYT